MHFEILDGRLGLVQADLRRLRRIRVPQCAKQPRCSQERFVELRFASRTSTTRRRSTGRVHLRLPSFGGETCSRFGWLLVRLSVDAVRTEHVQSVTCMATGSILVARGEYIWPANDCYYRATHLPVWIRVRLGRHRAGSAYREPRYRTTNRRRSDSPSTAHAAAGTNAPRARGRDGRRRGQRIEDGAGARDHVA
jgi:hypothetical protein